MKPKTPETRAHESHNWSQAGMDPTNQGLCRDSGVPEGGLEPRLQREEQRGGGAPRAMKMGALAGLAGRGAGAGGSSAGPPARGSQSSSANTTSSTVAALRSRAWTGRLTPVLS